MRLSHWQNMVKIINVHEISALRNFRPKCHVAAGSSGNLVQFPDYLHIHRETDKSDFLG